MSDEDLEKTKVKHPLFRAKASIQLEISLTRNSQIITPIVTKYDQHCYAKNMLLKNGVETYTPEQKTSLLNRITFAQ